MTPREKLLEHFKYSSSNEGLFGFSWECDAFHELLELARAPVESKRTIKGKDFRLVQRYSFIADDEEVTEAVFESLDDSELQACGVQGESLFFSIAGQSESWNCPMNTGPSDIKIVTPTNKTIRIFEEIKDEY